MAYVPVPKELQPHKGGGLISKAPSIDQPQGFGAAEICRIMKTERRGSLYTLTIRGEKDETLQKFDSLETIFCEVLPLTLEEIFISETEVVGYDIKKLILEI